MQLSHSRRRGLIVLAGLLYTTMIVLGAVLSTLPDALQQQNDKLLHLLAYGGLATLLSFGLQAPPLRRCGLVVLTIAVLGGIDEAIQSLFPHRHADVMDWLVDVLAAGVVSLVFGLLRRRAA